MPASAAALVLARLIGGCAATPTPQPSVESATVPSATATSTTAPNATAPSAPSATATGEWEDTEVERTHGEASMIGARASFAIALPRGIPAPKGSEGATIWEGEARAGRRFHVQVSLQRSPKDLEAAAGLVSTAGDEEVTKSRTDDGYRVIATSTRTARVFRTKSMNELSLVCEASITATRGTLTDTARAARWLDEVVCGSVRPID